jgi:hypothetical protein
MATNDLLNGGGSSFVSFVIHGRRRGIRLEDAPSPHGLLCWVAKQTLECSRRWRRGWRHSPWCIGARDGALCRWRRVRTGSGRRGGRSRNGRRIGGRPIREGRRGGRSRNAGRRGGRTIREGRRRYE